MQSSKYKMCPVTSAMTTWSVSHTHKHTHTPECWRSRNQTGFKSSIQLIAIKKKTLTKIKPQQQYTETCTVEHWISALSLLFFRVCSRSLSLSFAVSFAIFYFRWIRIEIEFWTMRIMILLIILVHTAHSKSKDRPET